ncbi:MAG TPA: hypothetical protein VGR78_00220 [Verrucomicrobiae bacterium]|nr:hypothetical protein [Verrucomicrobiae bacterium]
MTLEQVAEWKENLQKLVQQGPQMVPAIADFLKKNQDIDFGASGKQALGYSSARRAMFDALAQIGGPEASGALTQVLQDSADPHEISALADALAKAAPGQHTAEVLQAAHDVLGMAAGGKLPNEDVGPLFEVLQRYGDQSVTADLENDSSRWKYYSAMALANLPDGAGVPSLIRMLDDNSGNKLSALQMLAQVANQYPEARTALLDQARGNKIAANFWPYLIDGLAGREYHYSNSENGAAPTSFEDLKSTSIKFGNQNYYTVPSPSSASQEFVDARLAIINDLKSATSDPAARGALEQSQLELTGRLPKITAK